MFSDSNFTCLFFCEYFCSDFRARKILYKKYRNRLVLDIKGGLIEQGNAVRPHVLNHTRAQIFKIEKNDTTNNVSLNSYQIKTSSPGPQFFLTAKKKMPINDGGIADSPSQGSFGGLLQDSAIDLPQENLLVENGSSNNPVRTLKIIVLLLNLKRLMEIT